MLFTSAGLVEGKKDVRFFMLTISSAWISFCFPVYPFPSILQKVVAGAHTVPAGSLHAVPLDDGQFAAAE